MKNQGQNGVQKQAMSKKVRESALTGQKQGRPTDSVSIGLDLGRRPDDTDRRMKFRRYISEFPQTIFHGQGLSLRKRGTVCLKPIQPWSPLC